MSRRPRPLPLEEGSLRIIYEWFFRPLVQRYGAEEQGAREYLENLFDPEVRPIQQWKARRAFKIPGLFYSAGALRVQGLGFRHVKRGTILMVRTNGPDSIDVEFMGGQGAQDQVFNLSQSEWDWVKLNLKEETYDSGKPRPRNRMRRRRVRRVDNVPGQQREEEEGKV